MEKYTMGQVLKHSQEYVTGLNKEEKDLTLMDMACAYGEGFTKGYKEAVLSVMYALRWKKISPSMPNKDIIKELFPTLDYE